MGDSFSGPVRLLHVDGSPDVAELTTSLERRNESFRVETALDADEALDLLSETDVDCVVSDYELPGRDGIELLEAVRERAPDLPFILFTAEGSEELASEAISAGVTDYLQRGTGTEQYAILENRVENAVERYRCQHALEASRRRLSLLFEESPLGVVEWTDALDIKRANDTAAEILGSDSAALVGRSWETLVPESEREETGEMLSTLLADEGGHHGVTETLRVDGERVVCEWHNRVVTGDDGSVLAAFTQFRDVTDRERRHQRKDRQHEALVELATDEAVVDGDFRTVLSRVTETAAAVLDVPRTNVWLLDDSGETARCIDHYDRETDRHERGQTLDIGDHPAYFEALTTEWAIDADDARTDPRTAELTDDYLAANDVGALLDATFRSGGECLGFVCHEHVGGPREWTDDEIEFAGDVADIVNRALRNQDRDERRRQLREERAFIEQAVDTLDDIFYVVGTDGAVQQWNRRLTAVTGYDDEFVDGIDATEFFPERERERVAAAVETTVETGRTTFEADLSTADGPTPYEFINARLTDPDGDTVGLVGVGRDISDRREREREAAFFTELVETVGIGVAVYGQDGCYEYVNEAYASILETDVETLDGTPIWEINPRLDHECFEAYWEGFEAGETKIDETVHNLDGTERPVQTVTTCREIGGTTYHFGTITDITERKQREREIQRQNERLEEFASIVSHDLRNPLQVASGHLELARRELDSDYLDDVADAHERMDALVTDLLTLAREGGEDHDPEPVVLADLVAECWGNVETAAATLSTETDRTVVADPRRLRRLFENLVHNAVEHSSASSRPGADDAAEHGSDAVTVTVGDCDGGFYVADDGRGIPESDREQVFENGYTTAETGTGFGLAIVKETAAAHDWDVTLTEGAEGGARFEFTGVEFTS